MVFRRTPEVNSPKPKLAPLRYAYRLLSQSPTLGRCIATGHAMAKTSKPQDERFRKDITREKAVVNIFNWVNSKRLKPKPLMFKDNSIFFHISTNMLKSETVILLLEES